MSELIHALDVLIGLLRSVFGVLILVAATLAVLDWLVRTRRVNAFGPVARFTRAVVDPLLKPVEQRLVRAGGTPGSAPWWGLLGLIVVGAVLIMAVGFAREQLVSIYYASSRGSRGIFRLLVGWAFAILQVSILVRVITSWIGGSYSKIGRLAYRLTEWMLAPLRRVLPAFGTIDISPLVAWLALMLMQGVVMRAL
jgi:YggT family protein